MSRLHAPVLLLLLAACGPGLERHPEVDAGPGAADGGALDAGATDAGPTCPEDGGAAFLSCTFPNGTFQYPGAMMDLACALDGGLEPVTSWTFDGAPLPVTASTFEPPGQISFSFSSVGGPLLQGDDDEQVTLTAHFCQAAPARATVSVAFYGNTAVADRAQGLLMLDANNSPLGVAAADVEAQPTLVASLSNGHLLIGGASGALHEIDRAGRAVGSFATQDGSGAAIFPSDAIPWSAAESDAGELWVSAACEDAGGSGRLVRFALDGGYLGTVSPPSDPGGVLDHWNPMDVAQLPGGAMAVAVASTTASAGSYIAIYADGANGVLQQLDMRKCTSDIVPQCTALPAGSRLGGLAVLSDGYLYASTVFTDDGTVSSFVPSSFAFRAGTQHPWLDAFSGESLGHLADDGNFGVLASCAPGGTAVFDLSTQQLYPAEPTGNNTVGPVGGLAHLPRAP